MTPAFSSNSAFWRVEFLIALGAGIRKQIIKCKVQIIHASATVHRWFNGSEVSQWLALRAGVLRRAVSQSGTTLGRGAWRVKRWLTVEDASAVNHAQTPNLQSMPRTDHSKIFSGLQGASCAFNLQSHKSANLTVGLWFRFQEALANQSLNRTFCGSRLLGFIAFSPNTRLPQNAG